MACAARYVELLVVLGGGSEGEGVNVSVKCSVSKERISVREEGCNQAGGRMLARRWRFRSRASQRGRGVGKGGLRASVGPW